MPYQITDRHTRVVPKNYILKVEAGTQIANVRANIRLYVTETYVRAIITDQVRMEALKLFVETYGDIQYDVDQVSELIYHDLVSVGVDIRVKRG